MMGREGAGGGVKDPPGFSVNHLGRGDATYYKMERLGASWGQGGGADQALNPSEASK